MGKAVIDRLTENGQAVLLINDTEEERVVEQTMLPTGAKEGSHVVYQMKNGAILVIQLDEAATKETTDRVESKMSKLREKKNMRRGE